MMKLFRLIKELIPGIPPDQQKRFRDEVCHQNVVRMQVMSWVTVIVMTVLLVIQVLSPAEHALSVGLRTYIGLRVAMVVLCLAFVVIARRPRSYNDIVFRHHIVVVGSVTLLCMLAAVWVGLSQQWLGAITFYLIMIFVLASFVNLAVWESGLALSIGLAVLIGFINSFQADPLIRTHNVINGTVLTVLAFCVAQLSWFSGVQRFLDRLTIERQAAELRRLSFEDALTGLANRRQAQEKLEEEWERGMRSGKPLSLIMLDIDRFKAFNDNYGHVAGDKALQRVAQTLQSQMKRGTDLVTRYGGEEFLVILAETDLAGAECIARRLRQAVWGLSILHEDSEHDQMTVSLGVASMCCTAETKPQALVEAADQALYRAKRQGRNQVAS